MTNSCIPWLDAQLLDDDARRAFECERFVQEVTSVLSVSIADASLTQADVAARLGKSAAFVSQVLSGRRNATLHTIAELAWATGVRLSVQPQISQPSVSVQEVNQQSSILPIRRFNFQPRSAKIVTTIAASDVDENGVAA